MTATLVSKVAIFVIFGKYNILLLACNMIGGVPPGSAGKTCLLATNHNASCDKLATNLSLISMTREQLRAAIELFHVLVAF